MLNIFFDVDYTLLSMDGSLRPGTREVFQRLIDDGHRLYIWSGVGMRTADVQRHELEEFVSGIFQKPLENFEEGLETFGVTVRPDFVIDDYPEIVGAFGGVVARPYYFKAFEDNEMERIYKIVSEYVETGHSDEVGFRPGNNGSTGQTPGSVT